ncbi:hypothetical protein [Paractinoplanes maris]|nr:hypothetical protein [Actinoplanes maris]
MGSVQLEPMTEEHFALSLIDPAPLRRKGHGRAMTQAGERP